MARGSYKTGEVTAKHLEQNVAPLHPDVVVIALSLGSEGLPGTQTEAAAQRICDTFMEGIRELVNSTVAIGASPVVCECYPHGAFNAMHYGALKTVNRRLGALGVPILPMLAAVDDGAGRWKEGLSHDAEHPNAAGHYTIFRDLGHSIAEIFS